MAHANAQHAALPGIGSLAVFLVGSGLSLCLLCCSQSPNLPPADLILENGRIFTLDPNLPDAEALAIRGDRIIALGTKQEISVYRGPNSEVLDLQGRLAIPGFIEGHGHFLGLGESLSNLNLAQTRSWDEIVELVRESAGRRRPGEWILGRGWHQEKWDKVPQPVVEGLPTHDSLSRAVPDHPVVLTHASGHGSFANSKAMSLAGITVSTPDPEGGQIVRDSSGLATGFFRETAQSLLYGAYQGSREQLSPASSRQERLELIRLAREASLRRGITSFHDAGSSFEEVDLLRELADKGELGIRLYVMLAEPNSSLADRGVGYKMIGAGNGFLTVRSIKRYLDGALGSHGAWLLEPYADLPGSAGLNTYPLEELRETARISIENGFQLCVHAIGDRANREVLNVYEEAFSRHPEKSDLRWRVEHAQHIDPADVPRFAALGVIPAMQGVHCTSDGPWLPLRLGHERCRTGAYVWRDLLQSGSRIVNGTDAPVEDVNPIASFYSSISRQMGNGRAFYPEQRMTRLEALRSYTLDAAYGAFQDQEKGSLEIGKLADIAVLSKDILSVPEEEIPSTEVVLTILGGKVVYRR